MSNIKKPQTIFTLATILMILFVAFSLVSFSGNLSSHMYSDVEARLQEGVGPNLVSFNLQMQEQIKKVNTFAQFLGENWDLGKDMHTSLLQSAVENNGLLRCAIAYPDGSFITHDNKNDGNVSSDAFFIANMKGDFFVTDPRPAVVDPSKLVILFAAPVLSDSGEILGSVIYSYLCDDMDKIFNLKSMGNQMTMTVTKENGEILVGESDYAKAQENLIDSLVQSCTHQTHKAEECLSLVGDSGMYVVTLGDGKDSIYVRYDKLDYNDWYMIATVPESAATSSIAYAAKNQRNLSIVVFLAIAIYVGAIFVIWLLQRKMIDPETGALTIYAFKKKAKKIFRNRQTDHFVVIKLDVKDFKLINRIHSFTVGDKVIRSIAQSLKYVLNDEQSIFARIGIDVFALLLPYNGREALNAKRQDFINHFRLIMNENFSTKIAFPTGQYVLKPSDFPKPSIDEILEKVNFAHRAAKQNCEVIIDYEDDIESAALFEKNVEDRMESAIKSEEFTLYLQPKVKLSDESICGAEALVRWKVGDKYYMYPTDFVPILEKNGFIVQLDKYMFSCAVRFIRNCLDNGIKPIPISVNFSRHHLNNNNFVKELCEITDSYGVPRSYLEVELTESAFLGHIGDIMSLIEGLHSAGFKISMDDFGNGYSCFAQLKDLKIDVIKIDKGFFSQSEDEKRAEVVIAGILKIAQQLNITTVAEGIEHKNQVDMLKDLGCDIIQGYYYCKPMPAVDLDIENFVAGAGID